MVRILQDHYTKDSADNRLESIEMVSSAPTNAHQRIAFVQYGDFFVDATRLGFGGPETYFAQRYSVELVERLTQSYGGIMVICLRTGPYERVLPSGVRCIGMPNDAVFRADRRQLWKFLQSWGPTTVVVRMPSRRLLADCLKANWRLFPILADSFRGASWRNRLGYLRLARLLNHPSIEFVANHQVAACRDLVRVGVDPAKVIPWDWPSTVHPSDNPVKSGVRSPGELTVMYAGSISEAKGVNEVIEAVAHLRRSDYKVCATIAGKGDIDHFRSRAARLGVADRINFIGLIPQAQVLKLMQDHDVVVVPSRHAFPEGLPMAIYEALMSRSPLVMSDHPMFPKMLTESRSALVFPQMNSDALADCLRSLMHDTELYARLSRNSAEAWQRLRIPVVWGELLERWLVGGPENTRWLQSHTLTRHKYE